MKRILVLLTLSLSVWRSAFVQGEPRCPTGRELDELFPKLMREASIPGLSAALIRHGELAWTGAFGVKDANTREPVTTDTVFEAASLSKPVFAATVMQWVARGALDLEAPLWKTLPNRRLAHDPRARQITGRMALSHKTGLPNWGGTPLEMKFAPGTEWGYSGEGYVYFQQVVEKVAGVDLDALARREILAPAGMRLSGYVWRSEYEQLAAAGHSWLSEPRDLRREDHANAAASFYTTASDYARFLQALLSDSVFAKGTLDRMGEPFTQVSPQGSAEAARHLGWGLGWGVKEGRAGRALWHWGDNGIFRCFVIFYPDRGDGLVYFTNSENGLAIAGVVESLFGDDPWASKWLDYAPLDDPKQQARRSVVEAFLSRDFGAGVRRLESWLAKAPDLLDEDWINRIGYDLLQREAFGPATEVFLTNLRRHPESSNALDSLAEAQLRSGGVDEALENLKRAASLAPDNRIIQKRLDWVEDLARCNHPAQTAIEDLRGFEGGYGSRMVFLRDGQLYFRREGTDYALIPTGGGRFAVEGENTLRLRFLSDEEGEPIAVEGEHFDGRVDRAEMKSATYDLRGSN